jgi:formylglycine-generating enzyme required for sulfatase activity
MNQVTETLKKLIAQHGIIILSQEQRLKAMLADLLPDEKRMLYLLDLSLHAGIPAKLRAAQTEMPLDLGNKINTIKHYFKEGHFLEDKAVNLVFDCWNEVLGIKQISLLSDQEIKLLANFTETLNGISFDMIFVESGTFLMGNSDNANNKPVHNVNISNFYIGKTTVTQKQWRAIMGSDPSYFKNCDNCPVENVSWNQIQKFLQRLNQLTNKNYRLPTEAEWEYAAKGGNKSKGYIYSGSNILSDVAWFDESCNSKTHSVALKKPNEIGIYDMSGNVYEFCEDWSGEYPKLSQTNPKGPLTGFFKVLRGGSWFSLSQRCLSSYRASERPDCRYYLGGFRIVLAP